LLAKKLQVSAVTGPAIYEFTSVCGQNFETDDPNCRACPECGRSAVLDWKPAEAELFERIQRDGAKS
jgi:hypothetical protein